MNPRPSVDSPSFRTEAWAHGAESVCPPLYSLTCPCPLPVITLGRYT